MNLIKNIQEYSSFRSKITEISKIKIILILTVISIVISILLQFSPQEKGFVLPESPSITSNNIINKTEVEKIIITVDKPAIPNNLAIFQISNQQPLLEVAKKIALQQNLEKTVGQDYSWTGPTGIIKSTFLTYSPSNKRISYNHQTTKPKSNLVVNDAITAAQKFIEMNVLDNNFEKNNLKIRFEPDITSITTTNYDRNNFENYSDQITGDSEIVIIPFIQTIGGFNVYSETQSQQPLWVWIGPDYQIIKIEIKPFVSTPILIDNGVTIDYEIVKKIIIDGKGIVLDVTDNGPSKPIFKSISQATLSDVEIEYRFDPNSNLLIPYFKFSGEAIFTDKTFGNISIIYQAIHSKNTL